MEKEFIPYEQALALKELGFDEDCLGTYYEEDKSFYMNGVSYSNSYFTKAQELIPEHPQITTPLYQQAFRWFREKHYLFTQDFIDLDNKFTKNIVKVLKNGQDFFYLDYYKTYEEAELECLKKLIEIIKTWKK